MELTGKNNSLFGSIAAFAAVLLCLVLTKRHPVFVQVKGLWALPPPCYDEKKRRDRCFFSSGTYCPVSKEIQEVDLIENRLRSPRATELLEKCFDVFCENGLENTTMKMLSQACGVSNAALVYYFGNMERIVIEATAHCMAKVEDDFMALAPKNAPDIERFLRQMPRVTAEMHGAKYRFMYQVYASPKYRQSGRKFFEGVNRRYGEYARQLSGKLGLPADYIQGMTYSFVRACVHYALFEDEEYLNLQLNAIRTSLRAVLAAKNNIRPAAKGGAAAGKEEST